MFKRVMFVFGLLCLAATPVLLIPTTATAQVKTDKLPEYLHEEGDVHRALDITWAAKKSDLERRDVDKPAVLKSWEDEIRAASRLRLAKDKLLKKAFEELFDEKRVEKLLKDEPNRLKFDIRKALHLRVSDLDKKMKQFEGTPLYSYAVHYLLSLEDRKIENALLDRFKELDDKSTDVERILYGFRDAPYSKTMAKEFRKLLDDDDVSSGKKEGLLKLVHHRYKDDRITLEQAAKKKRFGQLEETFAKRTKRHKLDKGFVDYNYDTEFGIYWVKEHIWYAENALVRDEAQRTYYFPRDAKGIHTVKLWLLPISEDCDIRVAMGNNDDKYVPYWQRSGSQGRWAKDFADRKSVVSTAAGEWMEMVITQDQAKKTITCKVNGSALWTDHPKRPSLERVTVAVIKGAAVIGRVQYSNSEVK